MDDLIETIFTALSDDDWEVDTLAEALEKIEYYKEAAHYCKIYR